MTTAIWPARCCSRSWNERVSLSQLRPGKLRARQGAIDEAESLLSAAMALIESSDQLDLQGNGLLDFAEVWELAGHPADAAALGDQAAMLFERKGNVISARRARQLAERLRA